MSAESNNPKVSGAELKDAMKSVEALGWAIQGLAKSHLLQTDLELIRLWYTEAQRIDVVGQLDSAKRALDFADEVMDLVLRRSGDARDFEQYEKARGNEEAVKAFTSERSAKAHVRSCRESLDRIKSEHPVLSRAHALVRGW